MLVSDSITSFLRYFQKKYYKLFYNEQLRTDDPTLLFNNSTIVAFKDKMEKNCEIPPTAVLQKCFRDNSDDHSFSYFTMVGIIGDYNFLQMYLNDFFTYLVDVCKIPRDHLTVVYDRQDPDFSAVCKSFITDLDGYFIDGETDKFAARWTYGDGFDITGKGLTVVYTNPNLDKCSDSCNIHCNCLKYVQIGNIIKVASKQRNYIDIGFGLERIMGYHNDGDLYKLDRYGEVIQKLKSRGYCVRSAKAIFDNYRSALKIIEEGYQPGNKREGYILKKLIRNIGKEFLLKNIEIDFAQEIKGLIDLFQESSLVVNQDLAVIKMIQTELEKYHSSIFTGLSKASKVMTQENLSEREAIEKINSTYGIPELIIEKFLMDGDGSQ